MALQEDRNQIDIPPNLICSITHEVMEDPVMTSDGHSYERAAIQEWLNSGRNTSPLTGVPLRDRNLRPNLCLKRVIDEFKASIPDLQRRRQIDIDFAEACRLREIEINEALATPTEKEREVTKLFEESQAKYQDVSQQLQELKRKFEQIQNVVPNMNNNDLFLSITPQSQLRFLRRTHILLTPSQSIQDPIDLNDTVQSGGLIRGDNDAWAITRMFSGHYYLFYQTEKYYLTLELRKSLCRRHGKKEHRYIFTRDFILACNDCKKENPNEEFERFDRKSLVDFSIQKKPKINFPQDEKEIRSHLYQQEIIKSKSRDYPYVVEIWNAKNFLTLKDLLKRSEELADIKYGFLSFNCRDFVEDLQQFTKPK
jgi:hypothetical protein